MKNWILIEDEPDLYDVLCYVYTIFGAEATAFTTGEDALAWLTMLEYQDMNHRESLPVFALIDIRLPGMLTGIDVAEQFRRHPLINTMPIVLMTAYRLSPKQEEEALQRSGANRLIYKPLPPLAELHRLFLELGSPGGIRPQA